MKMMGAWRTFPRRMHGDELPWRTMERPRGIQWSIPAAYGRAANDGVTLCTMELPHGTQQSSRVIQRHMTE